MYNWKISGDLTYETLFLLFLIMDVSFSEAQSDISDMSKFFLEFLEKYETFLLFLTSDEVDIELLRRVFGT